MFQVSSIFSEAYLKAAKPIMAINGSHNCSTVPFDRNIFSEADFLAAEVTNEFDHTQKFPQEAKNTAERADDSKTSVPATVISQLLPWLP
jgi:hypothetical protein